MTTTTATTTASTTDPEVGTTGVPASGPFARVVAASMATGALAAATTTFVGLPSASEARVTGAALLAFAAAWALLACATARLTTRPQRWAYLPATVLAVGGAALLLTDPGESLLSELAWVWAPALAALGVWAGWRARRELPGRASSLVLPVAALMLAAGVGGLVQAAGGDVRTAAGAAPGRLVDVGGYRLHLQCSGTGAPTVVLLNGLGETSPQWARVLPAVAATSRVCAYDRAGQGWSDDSRNLADATHAATDLHALLVAAGERGPFVLAGHSSGGVHALTFTHLYPSDVAGLVLLDSASPNQTEVVTSFNGEYQLLRRALAPVPTLFRFGIGRLTQRVSAPVLPGDAGRQSAVFANSPRGWAGMRAEQAALPQAFAQARALSTLGDLPLVVLTARDNVDAMPGWATAQDQLAALSSNARHTVADLDHVGFLHDPAGAAQSVTAIRDVVTAARAHGAVPAE